MNQPVFIPVYTRAARARATTYDIGLQATKSTAGLLWGMLLMVALFIMSITAAHAADKRVVVLGDSLTAGYGLEGGQAFPEQLEIALRADGMDVRVENAGVSGDTTAGGLSRLEWAIEGDAPPNLVIVALGANDMLRGLPVSQTRNNLTKILEQLKEQKIPVLIAGMHTPAQYALLFRTSFDKMYEDLAKKFDVELYPFFLEGVALHAELNQQDGIHPNQKGVAIMVKRMAPIVKELLDK